MSDAIRDPLGAHRRPCRACAARPALMHEQLCSECFSASEMEREVIRIGGELACALKRIDALEAKVAKVRRPTIVRRYVLAPTERQERRRTYNREWMRAYRARRRVA